MAELVLKNLLIYAGGKEFSNNLSQAILNYSVDLVDRTGFGSSGRQRLAGLHDIEMSGNGFWDSGATSGLGSTDYPDPMLFNNIGTTNNVWSALPVSSSRGSEGYSFQAVSGDYAPGASIGDMLSFTFSVSGDGKTALRGKVIGNGQVTSAPTQGAEIGVVSSSQDAYVAFHYVDFSSSGAGGTVEVLTDNASGFPTPSTMFSFSINSSDNFKGSQLATTGGAKAGSTGDSWWKINFVPDTTGDTIRIMGVGGKK